tara:strand:- start:193 stop:810 length:618 start_codon:yes stop_codon:yes gene_type:complete
MRVDVLGNIISSVEDRIFHDGIEFGLVHKFEVPITHWSGANHIWVSRCGKIFNTRTKKYVKQEEWHRESNGDGKDTFKGMRFNFTADIRPFHAAGHNYQNFYEGTFMKCLKMPVHQAVLTTFKPYRPYLEQMLLDGIPEKVKEDALSWPGIKNLINLCMANCMIDHIDDNPRNNHIDNLRYSNLKDNAVHRKKQNIVWNTSLDKE